MSPRQDSEIARLEQMIQEERLARQEAYERAEQERRRAEDQQRAQQEAAQVTQVNTRPTTFEEYIRACHTFLSKPLRIQMNKALDTQGAITSNKPCPTLLKPWTEFPVLQQQLFESIHEYIPRDAQLFSSTSYLKELGRNICGEPLVGERDVVIYEQMAIERPITDIISHFHPIEEARREFNLGGRISFDFQNYANTLSDNNDVVQQSLYNLNISTSSNPQPRNAAKPICVYEEADGSRRLYIVGEYKPSHELSVSNLRAGLLRADKGSLNIPEDILNQTTIPTDPEEQFVYHSQRLTAAALSQTYAYMIENGLEYGKLATGEADVFLHLKEDEPHTLYYHLAEPNIEAEAHSEVDILPCRTALGQTLTFCLMALESKARNQQWRNHALESAYKAVIDYDAILRQIPAEEKKTLTPPPSVFHARIHPFKQSPFMSRPRKSLKARGSADVIVHEDQRSPSGSSDQTSDVESPSKPGASSAAEESEAGHPQYCTQACLLGLAWKGPLDETCPNINAHRAHASGNYHAIGRKSLAKLILQQLAEDPEHGCEPLGKQGARGALFRLTLESYGYTFLAKGTVTAFKADLQHEGLVYRHLAEVQGELIPVYLGNISLIRPYFLDVGVRIVHMLLLSWAGEEARKDLVPIGRDVATEAIEVAETLLSYGVEHGDVRLPNVLWNPEIGNVMLIDFERSEILEQVPVLQETSHNRKREHYHLALMFDPPIDPPPKFRPMPARAPIKAIPYV